ncbi:MAG TPA: glucose-6-phosphate dehydrogenase [Anaerolineales bacterium]|nr:glucose-6-phosphate dehydrogenase [Anaerolineales bacterium]
MTEPNDLPTTIVIFGASGDLTARKLVPALYHLFGKERLPEKFRVIGLSRTNWSDETFREKMREAAQTFAGDQFDQDQWGPFSEHLHYFPFDMTEESLYEDCLAHICGLEDGPANRLFYLATAPQFFPIAVEYMGKHGMTAEKEGWRRVIIEKPFGSDLPSALELNRVLHEYLHEHQIYRIDHYLAKETVQNLLVFRFGNAIFEPIWNRNYIDHVQITAAENVDVGHRGGYYDESGVFRDMFQNHLLQLVSLVAMEAPASFNAGALRNEKFKALAAVREIPAEAMGEEIVVGQYEGYLETDEVVEGSRTPTYAAVRFWLDNWRWQGVPFYVRSGKALCDKTTEILIKFKTPPHNMFPMGPGEPIRGNMLSICVQPDEGIHLRFEAKVPDTPAKMRSVDMEFHYSDDFGDLVIPEAYERLLLDALNGDASLFTRADSIEEAWRIIDPILQVCEAGLIPTAKYEKGSWGPKEADKFLARDGRRWQMGCWHE